MATLNISLTITSSDATSESLNINETDALSVGNPVQNTSRVLVDTSTPFNVLTSSGNTSITYVYLKNIDASNIITLKDDSGNNFLDLSPGEIAFLPVKGAIGLEALANTADCVLEYGYWTKA